MTRMFFAATLCCVFFVSHALSPVGGEEKGTDAKNPPGCFAQSAFREAWIKVAERACLKCHKAGGDAEESEMRLVDAARVKPEERAAAILSNCAALSKMAVTREADGRARLLVKATGGLEHGGGEVVKADSTEFRVLQAFVRSVQEKPTTPSPEPSLADEDARPFFDGVTMISDQRLLRRVTLSLAARLPTKAEQDAVATGGLNALPPILDGILREEAFYDRLREGFNDIFLTLGIDGNADATVLSYEHFEKSRLWYQDYDLSHIKDENERRQAGYKLANDYRKALLGEPMKLIEHIVRNDRPFTEIVTADCIMVTPFSARGYGIFDEVKGQFKNPDDPFEYVPVKLKALVGRSRSEDQESGTGFYPHAGLLSSFQYLARYPTTETNRNRLRARMYYQHFLGVDVLELAARVSDAAAVTAKYEIPTMQAPECVVCHTTLDPIAGMFQDYWRFDANFSIYGRRKEGWFTDMFSAGFEGEELPADERWRALQWLGERTAQDPRFAVTMVEHAYYILTGRRPLLPPKDLDDPMFAARRRAYQEQRRQVEAIATRFAATGFNFKQVIKDWVRSDLYRADGLATAELKPERAAELDDIGIVRMLSPEQLERKINAVFGKPWGRLQESYAILYGGIDSQEVTERLTEPSGAIGSLQRMMANDVACQNVAFDFAKPAAERRLFPGIEPSVVPGAGDEAANSAAEKQVRAAIVHLHQHVLGREDLPDDPEVEQTYRLFTSILAEAKTRGRFEPIESYYCKSSRQEGPRDADPNYTLRAWRGVVTYLLRQPEFLYE